MNNGAANPHATHASAQILNPESLTVQWYNYWNPWNGATYRGYRLNSGMDDIIKTLPDCRLPKIIWEIFQLTLNPNEDDRFKKIKKMTKGNIAQ